MNESSETREVQEDNPKRLVIPRTYGLGDRGRHPLLEFLLDLPQLSLRFAQIVSVLGCIATLVFGGYQLWLGLTAGNGSVVLASLIGTPLACLCQFALLVVFVRAAKASSR